MTAAMSVNWNRSNLMAAMSLISLSLILEAHGLAVELNSWIKGWGGLQGLNQYLLSIYQCCWFACIFLSYSFCSILIIMWQLWVYLTLLWHANISYFCVSSKGAIRFPHSLQFSRIKRNVKAEPGRWGLMFSFLALLWADLKKVRC